MSDSSVPAFVTVGHITADKLANGSYTPGGTVSFAALTARNLGVPTAIVTATTVELVHNPIYSGIEIVGPACPNATIFENIYTSDGRIQYVRSVAPQIQPQDVPTSWTGAESAVQIVHLGPVAQEFDGAAIAALFSNALIGVTPQGWLRKWDDDGDDTGRVRPVLWQGAEKVLSRATALVLSLEDLPSGETGQNLLNYYIELTPIVVLTQGPNGCLVYHYGHCDHVPAFPAREIDPTGAGDVFAAAFFIKLSESGNPITAACFAHAAAAINIEKPGLAGAPTLSEIEQRLNQ